MNDAPMTEEEIVAHLRNEAGSARHYYNTELADRQANALDFYDCEPFGDEEDGRSQYIEPVVEQTVDDMAVDIMEAFVSGDRVVEFEANDEASEQAAAEATEAIHYLFMRRQRGYRTTLDWLQSGFLETLGVVKIACYEDDKKRRTQSVVPAEALGFLDDDSVTGAQDNGDGTYTVDIEEAVKAKRYEVMPLPSEEFLFSPRMKSLDDKAYRAHATRVTISELVKMGFDRDIVEDLPAANESQIDDQRFNARWRNEGWGDREGKGANREVILYEEYDWIDIDDDGITELVRAYRVESTLLSIEPWEEQPFVAFTPYPRAHRLIGKGLAEKVMADQRVESVITRQMLDGLYASNAPRRWLPEESVGPSTIDDLLNVRPNAIIRGRGLTAPANLSENFDLSKSLSVLERFSQRRQSRTGILELGKGMDKDALNDTARGQAQLMQAGEKQIRYVARNFGEAMAEMFLKLMRLVRSHGEPLNIRIGKKWQQIDPSKWPEEMDLSIKVGLGTNGKDKRIGHRMTVAQMQAEAKAAGLGIVNDEKIFNTASGIIRDMDLGDPNDYWIDPSGEDYQPPEQQPDPAMAKAQADALLAAKKLEGQQQESAFKLQAMQAESKEKLALARAEAAAKAQLADEQQAAEEARAMRGELFEMNMAERQFQRDIAMDARRADRDDAVAVSKNRPGGDLDK